VSHPSIQKSAPPMPPNDVASSDETVLRANANLPANAGRTFRFPVWFWPMLAVAGLIGPFWYFRPSDRAALPVDSIAVPAAPKGGDGQGSPLGLQVALRDSGIEIQWDRSRTAIAGAQSGLLQVFEGTSHLELPLGHSELAVGRLFYVPKSGDIDVRLTAFTPAGAVQDVLRVVHAPGLSPRMLVQRRTPVPNDGSPAAGDRSPSPDAVAPSSARRADPLAVTQGTRPQSEPSVPPQDPPAVLPATEASQKEKPAVEPSVLPSTPAPPVPAVQTDVSSQLPPLIPKDERSSAVVQQAQLVQPPAAAPAPSRPQLPVRERIVTPAVPAKQVNPVVPPHLRAVVPRGATLEVRMNVDVHGNVSNVTTASGSGVIGHLAQLAKAAAQQWKFKPATVDGTTVPSEYVVVFRFMR